MLSRQLLRASYHKHHVSRRALGSKNTLYLGQDAFPFAVDNEAAHDISESPHVSSLRNISMTRNNIVATLEGSIPPPPFPPASIGSKTFQPSPQISKFLGGFPGCGCQQPL